MTVHRAILWPWAAAVALGLTAAGCATISEPRSPRTAGPVDEPRVVSGLVVRIWTEPEAVLGVPLVFHVSLRNEGSHGFWVPKDPRLVFVWVYPNGERDNLIYEIPPTRHFGRSEVRWLRPGEEIVTQVVLRTHFFRKPGITEFRALYLAEANTNPELTPFWHGRAPSNAFAVHFRRPYGESANARRVATVLPSDDG